MPPCRTVFSKVGHIDRNLRGSLVSLEKPQEVLMNPFKLFRSFLRTPVSTEEPLMRRLDGIEGTRQVATAPSVSVFGAMRRDALPREGQPS
jgi:type IV secretory pathway protease TraF